jgi:hypothetical protein
MYAVLFHLSCQMPKFISDSKKTKSTNKYNFFNLRRFVKKRDKTILVSFLKLTHQIHFATNATDLKWTLKCMVLKLDFKGQPFSKSTLPFFGIKQMQQCQFGCIFPLSFFGFTLLIQRNGGWDKPKTS